MKITLTPEQTVFLARAQSRLHEAMSSAASEQRVIQGFVSQHPFLQEHAAAMQTANVLAKAQQDVISDYVASLGHTGATLEQDGGGLVLVVPD
jgi:uncharacterized protein (DUF2342 family)